MLNTPSRERAPHLVDLRDAETIDVLGPTIVFLTKPEADDDLPCVMRGTIPPGVSVPLHSHRDPETFLAVSGEIEALAQADGDVEWIKVRPGNIFHVPGGTKHAFRNQARAPAVMIIVSTSRMGRFFQEIGTPVIPGDAATEPPSPETIKHFLETAERYGYWNASPEENLKVGISLPSPS